jgi:glycosyltransferase involved in cell wall biosynthesis
MTRTVVHFLDSPTFGGTEQALLHLLAGLDRHRWRPVLFHHREPGLAPLLEGAHALEIETKIIPRLGGMGTITALPTLIRELRAERPAVFHAHLCWLLSCKYALLAAAMARVPGVIATAQQYLNPPWPRSIAAQQRLFAICVDRYIAVSHAIAGQLCGPFRVPARKVQVVHNSVPRPRTDASRGENGAADLPDSRGRPMVLTVARLDAQKGHTVLLEAISRIPEATFVLAGDGPERATLEAKVRASGIADRIVFLGHRTDIPRLLGRCDLFVLPSLYEGFPLAIQEAMAAGRPVIASAVGGVPEAVRDGVTGLLVPPSDPAALADAIRRLLADPALAQRMGAAGRVRAEQEFSYEAMVQRTTRIYDDVLEPAL